MTTYTIEPERAVLHGTFSREYSPVLTVDSGDTVRFRTLDAGWHLGPFSTQEEEARKFEPRVEERDYGPYQWDTNSQVSAACEDNAGNLIVGTYGAMQDIHDRKAAEELWRQAEARFRAQYQSSPIPTYIWQKVGDDLVLVDFNRAAEALTSGSVSALLGRTARQLDVGPGFAADLDRAFQTGETIKRESSRKLPSSGELKSLFVTMAKVPPNLVMVHAVDVTEWRKAEADRRELRAKLRSRPAS